MQHLFNVLGLAVYPGDVGINNTWPFELQEPNTPALSPTFEWQELKHHLLLPCRSISRKLHLKQSQAVRYRCTTRPNLGICIPSHIWMSETLASVLMSTALHPVCTAYRPPSMGRDPHSGQNSENKQDRAPGTLPTRAHTGTRPASLKGRAPMYAVGPRFSEVGLPLRAREKPMAPWADLGRKHGIHVEQSPV